MNTILILLPLIGAMGHDPGAEMKYRSFLVRQVRYYWGNAAPVSTFAAQVRQESGWDSRARSSHAAGLAQFTPATAAWLAAAHPEVNGENGYTGPADWKWSLRAMVYYDKILYAQIGGGGEQRWPLTLRAYNGGIGWLFKEMKACRVMDEACCRRFRSATSCRENIAYPLNILHRWKPRYEEWDR